MNSRYIKDYRGETRWYKIKSDDEDKMVMTDDGGKTHEFLKSRILTSKSFRQKLEDHYSVVVPNMYVKIFKVTKIRMLY